MDSNNGQMYADYKCTTHTRIQVFMRLQGSRTPHLTTPHNLTTPLSYMNFTSQPHKY